MKSCVIFGNMVSDRTGEQYPTVNFCDACFERISADEEAGQIVNETTFDICNGEYCHSCEIPLNVEE